MKIRIERTGIKQINKYAELAPAEVLERAGRDKYGTAVALAGADGSEQAAGLMQYEIEKNKAKLLWIYVYREFRRQGIGRELVEYMKREAEKAGALLCEIQFSDYMAEDIEPDEEAAFFEKNGFTKVKESEGIFCLTGKDIIAGRNGHFLEAAGSVIRDVVPFSRCTPNILVEKAEKLKLQSREDILVADRNLSFFYETTKGVLGLVQCERTGGDIRLKNLVATDEDIMKKMLGIFFEIVYRKMRVKDKVLLPENDKAQSIIKGMFPGIKGLRNREFVFQMKGVV